MCYVKRNITMDRARLSDVPCLFNKILRHSKNECALNDAFVHQPRADLSAAAAGAARPRAAGSRRPPPPPAALPRSAAGAASSEERRGGRELVSTRKSRWSQS